MKRILVVLLLLVAPSVLAQPVGLEITPVYGFRTGGTIDEDTTDVFLDDAEVDDSGFYGVIVDVDLSRYLQLELLFNHQQSELDYEGDLFEPGSDIGDIDVTYWQAGLIWRHPATDVQPFFGMTLGGTTLKPDLPGLDSENKFGGSMGGGVKVFLNRNIGLRLEGRGYWTYLGDSDNNDCCYDYYYDYGESFTQFEGSLGLIIAF